MTEKKKKKKERNRSKLNSFKMVHIKKSFKKIKQNCLTKMPTLSSFQLVLLPAKLYAKKKTTPPPSQDFPGCSVVKTQCREHKFAL